MNGPAGIPAHEALRDELIYTRAETLACQRYLAEVGMQDDELTAANAELERELSALLDGDAWQLDHDQVMRLSARGADLTRVTEQKVRAAVTARFVELKQRVPGVLDAAGAPGEALSRMEDLIGSGDQIVDSGGDMITLSDICSSLVELEGDPTAV